MRRPPPRNYRQFCRSNSLGQLSNARPTRLRSPKSRRAHDQLPNPPTSWNVSLSPQILASAKSVPPPDNHNSIILTINRLFTSFKAWLTLAIPALFTKMNERRILSQTAAFGIRSRLPACLESRLKCPRCGSRRVALLFEVPSQPMQAATQLRAATGHP